MPFIISFPPGAPSLKNPVALIDWAVQWAKAVLNALRGLVSLDADVRELRTLNAETAELFVSAAVVAGAVTRLRDLEPRVITQAFTTALIMFDGAAGAGRWMVHGPDPTSAATAAAGMPVPAGGATLVITGQRNIANFAVIGEPAATLNMSVTLYK